MSFYCSTVQNLKDIQFTMRILTSERLEANLPHFVLRNHSNSYHNLLLIHQSVHCYSSRTKHLLLDVSRVEEILRPKKH